MEKQAQALYDDPEFARILEDSESYYEDAQSFFEWAPENGEHTCSIVGVKVDKIEDKKLKKQVVRVKVPVQIEDGDDVGKVFDLAGAFGWTPRSFTGLKTLASALAGEPIMTLPAALDILYQNVGTLVMVSTSRTPRDDGGDPWVNHRVTHRLETAPA